MYHGKINSQQMMLIGCLIKMSCEWKILKDGKIFTDRINSEELANATVEEYLELYPDSEFEFLEMTQDEIDKYYE